MKTPAAKREPKSGLERELESIRDVVRGLRRLDSETDRIRVINTALAFLKSARYVNTTVRVAQSSGVMWLPSEESR